jgi:hypothetical protein
VNSPTFWSYTCQECKNYVSNFVCQESEKCQSFHKLFSYFSSLYPFQIPSQFISTVFMDEHCCECIRLCCLHGFDLPLICQEWLVEGLCCEENIAAANLRQIVVNKQKNNKRLRAYMEKVRTHPFFTPDAFRATFRLVHQSTVGACQCRWCLKQE